MLKERIIHTAVCDKCGNEQIIMESKVYDARRTLIKNFDWIVLHSPRTFFCRESFFYMCPTCVKKYIPMDKLPDEIRIKYE